VAAPVVERIEWGRELIDGLGDTLGDDQASIAADVQTGAACGWRVDDGAAYIVTRIDENASRRECVVVAVAGRDLRTITPIIYNAAQRAGCSRIRWHTQRPGLARIVARDFDVSHVETVFSVEVTP
tara:strand:- start:1643 stop:2020 length:378 start_codon:yes stop_codon:yes gene_type:complete